MKPGDAVIYRAEPPLFGPMVLLRVGDEHVWALVDDGTSERFGLGEVLTVPEGSAARKALVSSKDTVSVCSCQVRDPGEPCPMHGFTDAGL